MTDFEDGMDSDAKPAKPIKYRLLVRRGFITMQLENISMRKRLAQGTHIMIQVTGPNMEKGAKPGTREPWLVPEVDPTHGSPLRNWTDFAVETRDAEDRVELTLLEEEPA